MMEKLIMIKIDYRERRFITELHIHQTTSIEINESKVEAAIRKGVRQGCKLMSLPFNIYIEQAVNKYTGIKLNGSGL